MTKQMRTDPFEELVARELRSYSGHGVRTFDADTISARARTAVTVTHAGRRLAEGLSLGRFGTIPLAAVVGLLVLAAALAFAGSQALHRIPVPGLLAVGGLDQILVVDPATGAVREVTAHHPHDGYPVWSPDGMHIAFSQHDGRGPIQVVDGDGGNLRIIGEGMGSSAPASWSPDGTQIAFSGYEYPGDPEPGRNLGGLYVAGLDGSAPRLLVPRPSMASGPASNLAWSPDGTRIAFGAFVGEEGIDEGMQAFVVDVASRQVTRISTLPLSPEVGPMSWAPDGSALAYTRLGAIDSAAGGIVVAELLSGAWRESLVIPDEPLAAVRAPMWLATGSLFYLRADQPWVAASAGNDRRQVSDVTVAPPEIGCLAPDASAVVLPVGAEPDGLSTEIMVLDLDSGRPGMRIPMRSSGQGPNCSWQAVLR